MNSREVILNRLRAVKQPALHPPNISQYRHVVPLMDTNPPALQAHFVQAAEKLGCQVSVFSDHSAALAHLLQIVGADEQILAWDFEHIPLDGLSQALADADIRLAPSHDGGVRVGVTGVDAALAATGSLVIRSGAGKPRAASLLPFCHVAVLSTAQLVPDLETWIQQERENGVESFRQSSTITLVSGPSRTADIALELVMGAHGPAELHLLLLS